jgi:hypothetical protein
MKKLHVLTSLAAMIAIMALGSTTFAAGGRGGGKGAAVSSDVPAAVAQEQERNRLRDGTCAANASNVVQSAEQKSIAEGAGKKTGPRDGSRAGPRDGSGKSR